MGRCKYSIDDWRAVRKALDMGGTIRGVAAETGVDRGAVLRWSRMDEPPGWMWLNKESWLCPGVEKNQALIPKNPRSLKIYGGNAHPVRKTTGKTPGQKGAFGVRKNDGD